LSDPSYGYQGMDHKMAIIFNKCDQFTKMHDFARAYGSLCWNLSKVTTPPVNLPSLTTPKLRRILSQSPFSRGGCLGCRVCWGLWFKL